MRRILFGISLYVLLASACAPTAPAIDPAQVQASAVLVAATIVAMTQAAIPTTDSRATNAATQPHAPA